jgi:hypothetical protein
MATDTQAADRVIPQALRKTLLTAIREHGERAICERLEISRPTLARAAGGLRLHRHTHALLMQRIPELGKECA